MKSFLKKLTALTLAAVLAASAGSAAALHDSEADLMDSSYYNGAYYYRPSTSELDYGLDNYDIYTYTDDYFKASGKEYNGHLATTSFSLAVASVSSTREPFTTDGYTRKSRNVSAFLEDIGFSEIQVNEDYKLKPTKNSIGVACAYKTIDDGDKSYPLLVIVPRSAGYEAEWGNNFVLGATGDAKGFDNCADTCLAFAKEYVAQTGLSGDIKVWVPGYSRGGAIANLIARKLIDAPSEYLGEAVTLDSDNLYAYTFGTPSAASSENDPRNERYAGIFNSFSTDEISSSMAPVDMGFERYGTDIILKDDEQFETMLRYLEICDSGIYNSYITDAGPQLFHAKKLSIGSSVSIVNDDNSYIPNDAGEYLIGFNTYLTQICGGREGFAATYEESLSNFLGYYMSLVGDNSTKFSDTIANDEETIYLAAAMYSYFMRTKSKSQTAATSAQAEKLAEELVAVGANEEGADTGISAETITTIAKKLFLYMNLSPDYSKKEAAKYLSHIMPKAMEASGATQEQISYFTNSKRLEPLVHVLSHLLLGNIWQSDKVDTWNLDNEQIKSAATLIGNFNPVFYDHYNEVITSRLKIKDSYYDDYQPMSDTQLAGYRRVYVDAPEDADIDGEIYDGSNKLVGVIENSKLTKVADHWIGYTTSDECGFLRLPLNESYTIRLTVSEETTMDITVGEYSVYDAEFTPLEEKELTIGADNAVIIDLSAPDKVAAIPSDASYAIYPEKEPVIGILGDADEDDEISILDATAVQRHLAELTVLTDRGMLLGDVDRDTEITILDATGIQRYLADIPSYDGIGEEI